MAASALMLALALAQPAPEGPPLMVAMLPPREIGLNFVRYPDGEHYLCSEGYGDCLRIVRGEDGSAMLELFDMDPAAGPAQILAALPAHVGMDDGNDVRVWDRAIRLPANPDVPGARAYLVGIVRSTPLSYSGGFARAERLHLFQLVVAEDTATLGPELLDVRWNGEVQLRACFGEEDVQKRREACHDIYRFASSLSLMENRRGAYPDLGYSSVATAFPRTAYPTQDSSSAPPLSAEDLVERRDPECSFQRTLRYNPATRRYEMDSPAPECASYQSL